AQPAPSGTASPGGGRVESVTPSGRAKLGSRSTPSVRAQCTVSANLVPSCGAWLGIWPRTRGDGTLTTDLRGNLASLEQRLGRRVDLVSRYYGWGQLPPDGTDTAWRDQHHLLLIDLRARDFSTNRYVTWRSIARGDHDRYLRTVASRLRDFRSPVFFSFNQEPEQELEHGTGQAGGPKDFAAAYRHIHDVVTGAGAHNVRWVWWVMGYLGHVDWYPDLYPGDRYVDWVSYDPYDFNACHQAGYESAAQSVLPFVRWLGRTGLGAGKPVMLSEFGSHGAHRGDWYRDLGRVVKRTPRIRAVVSFDSNSGGCDTRVTASADNWRGFRSIADDAYFRQRLPRSVSSTR
ncbi:MAG: glycosyl hydrolase, partial [Actinocatenispora sp.]